MVKKLLKHEFAYYFRTLGPFLPILLVIGLVSKGFELIHNGSVYTSIPLYSSYIVLYIGAFALSILTTVIGIVRFYKNLYAAEGYLTLTLPVTHHQHIWVKLLANLTFNALSLVVVALSVGIAFFGKPLFEFFRACGSFFADYFHAIPDVHDVLFLLEFSILLLLSLASTPLLYYACITIGQTAKKNRILLAIGVYFIHYMIVQAISAAGSIFFVFLASAGAFKWILQLFEPCPFALVHIILIFGIIISGAVAALYYFVTHYFMNKKLNLE